MSSSQGPAREFELDKILVITHRIPSRLDQYLSILEFMTGETLNTVQWVRAHVECQEWLLEQYPGLKDVPMPPMDAKNDQADMDAWINLQKATFGPSLPVLPLPAGRRPVLDFAEEMALNERADSSKPDFGLGTSQS